MAFILAHPEKEKSSILLSYKKGFKTAFRYSTGQSIEVNKWDKINQRAIKNTKVNIELERYENFLEKMVSYAEKQQIEITKEYLFNQFENQFKLKPKEKKDKKTDDFFVLMDVFIQDSKLGKRISKKGTLITPIRIKKYTTLSNFIKKFKNTIKINDIDINFYKEFISFCNGKEQSLNTIGTHINVLKVFLKETFKAGLHQNNIFENEDFRVLSENVENEFLNDSEIDILWNLENLSDKLELVRDVFIIGCYTGLRISDLGILDKYNIIKDKNLLKIIPEKTDDIVFIPIHPRVKFIIEKYNGSFPKAYSDQKMNEYIKELCKLAEFNQSTIYKRTKGGKVVKFEQVKFERITNHTARRSFATNLYLAGFDTISIMKITGHKKEENFMKYICVTQKQIAEKMLEHPYFKSE